MLYYLTYVLEKTHEVGYLSRGILIFWQSVKYCDAFQYHMHIVAMIYGYILKIYAANISNIELSVSTSY